MSNEQAFKDEIETLIQKDKYLYDCLIIIQQHYFWIEKKYDLSPI